ncbi:hypothetical protein KL908_000937 [Ogataea polymorpha]|nr:hypothetical protein KL908_000937 [Ogataea polymorpha]
MHQNASPNFSILGKTFKLKGPFCTMQGRELHFGPAKFCLKSELNRHYEMQFFLPLRCKSIAFCTYSGNQICDLSKEDMYGNECGASSNSTNALEELSLSGAYGWSSPQFAPILHTCNETYTRIINAHLQDSLEAAAFARNRLMEYGKDDEIFMRWFGDGSIYEVIGLLDYLVEANKDQISWRCDDISDKCDPNPTWGGYSYEESQNVLCPYFFQERVALSKMCFDGTIVETTPKHYGGIDMLHRDLHLPAMNTEYIQEYYEEIDEILDLAQNNATFATRNVDSYLYYIAEVYAESVVPGGCLGDL